jgi:Protein of unknown function (DUF2815).
MARTIVETVKRPDGKTAAILYSDGCIRIDYVRASYPHVDKPWAKNEQDRPKFSITGLADKTTHGAVKDLLVRQINAVLKDKQMGKIGSEHKFCRDGDDSGKDEAEGMWVIKASENPENQPAVRNAKGALITDAAAINKLIYPGCYVNILIRPWGQDNKHGKKVNANLVGVQYAGEGERFGEASLDDEDVWEELESEDLGASGLDDDDDDL